MPTTDMDKARHRFRDAGLAFPKIPQDLAAELKEQREWLYSTREIATSPYALDTYVGEWDSGTIDDYAIIAHSGHGVNSYAVQYYLAYGALGMFLHLAWGGAYTDANEAAASIGDCFALADEIVATMERIRFKRGDRLSIVISDFYGSRWAAPGENYREVSAPPAESCKDVLNWLQNSGLPPA